MPVHAEARQPPVAIHRFAGQPEVERVRSAVRQSDVVDREPGQVAKALLRQADRSREEIPQFETWAVRQQQLDEIGRVDVVFVPVDGNMTLDLEGMMEVLQALKAPQMIPMHFFSTFTLQRFLERARQHWTVEIGEVPSMVVSKTSLPTTPKVTVLPGH